MSRERPILFNGAMVRAILAGQKTQTRRVVRPAPETVTDHGIRPWEGDPAALLIRLQQAGRKCPFGHPGDRLWVRETWADASSEDGPCVLYRADDDRRYLAEDSYPVDYDRYPGSIFAQWAADVESGAEGRYRPSIHMPRWACRLVLEITDVRVERLQAISEADAMAEGAEPILVPPDGGSCPHIEGFRDIWTSTGGDWDANPWVWVIEFKRVQS